MKINKTSSSLMILAALFTFLLIPLFLLQGENAIKKEKDKKKEGAVRETALFRVDREKSRILSLADNTKGYLKMKFISVTTDQPVYWPNEDVHLKVVLPVNPKAEVKVSLRRKDTAPRELGPFTLNEGGLLVEKIMTGSKKKLEAGEYRVDVATADKKLQSYTTFSVVEGALGAVSFAYEFKQLTDPKEFRQVKGGWFLGNAAGAGKRWGNGLNLKNEVRVLNIPYTGKVTVKSRCYLPGCNGVEAGPAVPMEIKDGLLETVLNVSSHSGPFEVEVVTDRGSVRNLFGKSGHVERQTVVIASRMTSNFSATLAPYEGTIPVYGRDVYIIKEKHKGDDPLELVSPIGDAAGEIEIIARKDITRPRMYVCYSAGSGFKSKEVELPETITKGKSLRMKVPSPYGLIAFGGFPSGTKDFYEAWAIAFAPASLGVDISAPREGTPKKSYDVTLKTFDRASKQPVSVYGVLEVFDNRVSSKSPREGLLSAIGDSFRELSNYLSEWTDRSGIQDEMAEEKDGSVKKMMDFSMSARSKEDKKAHAPSPVRQRMVMKNAGDTAPVVEREDEIQETIREGERKVIYCGVVKTDKDGKAVVNITLPPQTGRCKIRFAALRSFDAVETVKDIDVKKGSFVELSLPPLLMPGAKVTARAMVVNDGKVGVRLRVSGAGVKEPLFFDIAPGKKEIEFDVEGAHYGTMLLEVLDAKGKVRDRRERALRDVSRMAITFSDIFISDGSPLTFDKGKRMAVYSQPGLLLKGAVMNMTTTIYSWFGHAEALSASAAVRAMLLRSIEEGIIDDEGMRDTLRSDLVKGVKDLRENFYSDEKRLFRPYPGVKENLLWSAWAVRNLKEAVGSLEGSDKLKKEFAGTIQKAKEIIKGTETEMKKQKVSMNESTFQEPGSGEDVLPVEIDGKVVYRAVTDKAVVNWYLKNMAPRLDLPNCRDLGEANEMFIKSYDTYRFLRAFERTGSLYYLLLNVKALMLQGNKEFYPLFNTIARGMIFTGEPGLLQGPALLGGVYSSPQTMTKFLELLVLMAKDKRIASSPVIEVKAAGKTEKITLGEGMKIMDLAGPVTVKAPAFVTVRVDDSREINMYDYLRRKAFFRAALSADELSMGDEADLVVELDRERDPSEYYAVIALPSVLSVKQTEDILSDYKGQILYGQKAAGGEKITLVTVPFRGSRKMIIRAEAFLKGTSAGFVLVRHIANPDVIATVKTGRVTVK